MPAHNRSGARYRRFDTASEREEQEWRCAAWTMFWLLAIGKLLTMIALAVVGLASLQSGQRTLSIIILWNWSWILLAVLLVMGPSLYWLRLRRVRRKRAALIRAEWHVDEEMGQEVPPLRLR